MPCAFRLRRFEREWLRGKPLHLRLMFNSAVRTLEPHWLAPDAGRGRVINVKVKINRLSSLRAPTNEITHRIAPKSQKNEGYFVAAFLVFGQLSRRPPCYRHAGEYDEARAALRHAIALAPLHANAHSGLGILLLMHGDFGEGWHEYEWRLRSTERKGPRFPERPWSGEPLAGKHIYIQAEQGFGDTLQFARYIPLLAARAGKVTLRVHQQLVRLLRESLPGITVLGDRGDPAPYQCDAVLVSLPRIFRTRLETIPAQVPYLRPPAEALARW